MSALTGSELLAKVKQLEAEGLGQTEMARETGYVSTKKDGTERVSRGRFLEALLEAKGVTTGGRSSSPGRKLTFRTRVQFNGNLMIGAAYTGQAGFKPGDDFQIIVGRKGFTLKPLAQSSEASEATDSCPDGTCPVIEQETESADGVDSATGGDGFSEL